MTIPTSTYRLQFRGDMSFDRAEKLLPQLADLGISHVYASPIFTATSGSTHGYDVVDPNEIDPSIGGRRGFDRFVLALRRAGLGLILDIVPNHMAASVENPWWRDVLRHGRESAYAGYFDIDWRRRLTLPELRKPLDEALAAGEFSLVAAMSGGVVELAYLDLRLPLSDESMRQLRAKMEQYAQDLRTFSHDAVKMNWLLAKQHWQLIHWKDAARNLSYRRFFEVAGLVGLKVEDAQVFADTHRTLIEMVHSGQVQGLRIDHIDGLADPKAYLDRLRKAAGPDVYIVVEKILARGETLPADWPVSGTTGYEFIDALADLFVSEAGLEGIDLAYREVGGDHADFAAGMRKAKLLMVERNFSGEVLRLTRLVEEIFPDFDAADISATIRELLVAFPVYRLYGDKETLSARDETVLAATVKAAQATVPRTSALGAIASLLQGSVADAKPREFQTRFQQLSGPIMAKAAEDTLFYRYNRFIALNEVGGEPAAFPAGVAAFHQSMTDRLLRQPHGLSATTTHDTKRGEDARARLYSLTQRPADWIEGFERWRVLNAAFRPTLARGQAPEVNVEWMLYQALAGIWPDGAETTIDRDELKQRFRTYALKAIREAKLGTDWADADAAYERAVLDYVDALVSPGNEAFASDFDRTLRPFVLLGYRNSLSQLLIKLTAPGIPDIYQGAERLDFSMVDPDNRRSFAHAWGDVLPEDTSGERKIASLKRKITSAVLRHRRDHPHLFLEGDYMPLEVAGARADKLVAFARVFKREIAVTVAPRLVDAESLGLDYWQDTTLILPAKPPRYMRDLLTGRRHLTGDVPVAQLFADRPVVFLVSLE
ncbi:MULTISPECIES: malto-oligosyltrehalose synthase [unclassified Rhizobium]|uniref:malto-oligosyltrehalose synthase n=1 Tax=unclassified Rhizobium TaxID=2613769 RepID=UPI0038020447